MPFPFATIAELFAARAATGGDRPALHSRRGEAFEAAAWADLSAEVLALVRWLARRGVGRGDRVAQVADNSREWIVADLAIQLAGAVHVPIHTSLAGPQIAQQIVHSGASLALVGSADLARRIAADGGGLPHAFHSFCYESQPSGEGSLAEELAEFRPGPAERPAEELRQRAADVRAEELATILFTSGTTGEPRGVMLSHGNLAFNAQAVCDAFGERPDDLRLTLLPLSHIYARTCDYYTWLVRGTQLALAASRDTVLADCQAIAPTLINGVPYFYQKVMRGIVDKGAADVPGIVQRVFGGRMRMASTGGAALPTAVFDFFHARGLTILEGYGLTETSPVISLSTPESWRRGSVGRPLAGTEVALADDGELLVRGPHVMQGYWRDDAGTAAVIDAEGWLHTGDLARQEEEGFLFITGRKKEMIALSTGRKVSPASLESLLTSDDWIAQACIVGEGEACLAGLVVPNPDRVRMLLAERQVAVGGIDEALEHPLIRAAYSARIDAALAGRAHYEQVRQFALLPRGFTPETGELTAKLTLRRTEIANNYRPLIDRLFGRDDRPTAVLRCRETQAPDDRTHRSPE